MAPSAAKIVSREELVSWRRGRAGVVLTNGVFDLLHPGHVECLEAARALGEALVVAVNSDASARGLGKGTGRPILGETDRARLVAGLGAVDRVVLFDEPTPADLIAALRPDVLVKGGDYDPASLPGASAVAGWGGRVVIVPRIPGYSTTLLVERCRAAT